MHNSLKLCVLLSQYEEKEVDEKKVLSGKDILCEEDEEDDLYSWYYHWLLELKENISELWWYEQTVEDLENNTTKFQCPNQATSSGLL